jgi:hypothetical protein
MCTIQWFKVTPYWRDAMKDTIEELVVLNCLGADADVTWLVSDEDGQVLGFTIDSFRVYNDRGVDVQGMFNQRSTDFVKDQLREQVHQYWEANDLALQDRVDEWLETEHMALEDEYWDHQMRVARDER